MHAGPEDTFKMLDRSDRHAPWGQYGKIASQLLGWIRVRKVAEGEGFEPPEAFTSTVFKTAPFDRSGIPPRVTN